MEFIERAVQLCKLKKKIIEAETSEYSSVFVFNETRRFHVYKGIEFLAKEAGVHLVYDEANNEKYFMYEGIKFFQIMEVCYE